VGILTLDFVAARLQPQLKKYRCLWWMSTTNHNILYFLNISGIHFLNKGKCLCKAQNALAGCGFSGCQSAPDPAHALSLPLHHSQTQA
jgi:hypothetical protein